MSILTHRRAGLAFFAALCFAGMPHADARADTAATDLFVRTAEISNQFEISSSQLALQKSQNPSIKQFAQHMVDDHTQVGNALKQTISHLNPPLTQPTNMMDSDHQKLLDKLNSLSGADFDSQYVKIQVVTHAQAVVLFRDYAEEGDNPTLKAFASQALPTLQEHKNAIDKLNTSF